MQKDIQKRVKTQLILMIVFSILAVAAIPGIVLGAINSIYWIMIPSIVLVAGGFYGIPIGWVVFGMANESKNVFLAITQDGIINVNELGRNFDKSVKNIQSKITSLINKRFLVGYKFNEGKTELLLIEKKKETKKIVCPYCGARMAKDETTCKYCGGHI